MAGFFDKVGTKADRSPEVAKAAPPSPPEILGLKEKDAISIKDFFQQDNVSIDENPVDRRWAVNDNAFWIAKKTMKKLPSGLYRCGMADGIGPYITQINYDIDQLVVLPDSPGQEIIEEIRKFWEIEGEFKKRGFTHKRGVLLWGPPGSGKTSTLQLLIELIVKQHNGIGVYIDHPGIAIECLQMIRRSEPGRHIIGLMEDLDALVSRYGEAQYLSMLDGENQIGNIVYCASTNYPEKLDRRFVDRPSRFDTIKEVDMPGRAERRAYLLAKEPSLAENDQITDWVKMTDGLSIAHLKELIILVKCYGHTLEEAGQRLKDMHNANLNSERTSSRGKMGF